MQGTQQGENMQSLGQQEAQEGKNLPQCFDGLSSIPGTHMVKEVTLESFSSNLHMYTKASVHTHKNKCME